MLEPVIGSERYGRLLTAAGRFRDRLGGRTVWNVNSTAVGGGVAEMLQVLVGYIAGLDIAVRWVVIGGDPEFFAITKKLHNQIHGQPGGGPLSGADGGHYGQVLAANADELLGWCARAISCCCTTRRRPGRRPWPGRRAGGVALSHRRGLAERHHARGMGLPAAISGTRARLRFLRRQYVPPWIPREQAWIIPPSIDPFSAKNQQLDAATVQAILATAGVLDGGPPRVPGRFARRDGTTGEVTRAGLVTGDGRPAGPADPVVVQVSRWDRLKDMSGVMRGFAEHVVPGGAGYLMLVGP